MKLVWEHDNPASGPPVCRGTTLTELVVAMAIMVTVMAFASPLFVTIRSSSAAKFGSLEQIQNARVFSDHLYRSLAQARRIIAVSSPDEIYGHLQYEGSDGLPHRYEMDAARGWIKYGSPEQMYDLAGPASRLRFICYDVCDLATPILDGNDIRYVACETILLTPDGTGRSKTLSTGVLLRVDPQDPFSMRRRVGSR